MSLSNRAIGYGKYIFRRILLRWNNTLSVHKPLKYNNNYIINRLGYCHTEYIGTGKLAKKAGRDGCVPGTGHCPRRNILMAAYPIVSRCVDVHDMPPPSCNCLITAASASNEASSCGNDGVSESGSQPSNSCCRSSWKYSSEAR